jgi:hypothetical protein
MAVGPIVIDASSSETKPVGLHASCRRGEPYAWTSLAPMPVSGAKASAVYYPPANKIYVLGGQRFSSGTTLKLPGSTIASNTWSAGAFMFDCPGLWLQVIIALRARSTS